MNGKDYIISGSCDEHVVRICCAQTGRRLRDISLEVSNFCAICFMSKFIIISFIIIAKFTPRCACVAFSNIETSDKLIFLLSEKKKVYMKGT